MQKAKIEKLWIFGANFPNPEVAHLTRTPRPLSQTFAR